MIRILLTSILLLGIAADTPGSWRAVFPYVDLETEPLEIETNSKIGSGDKVMMDFYDSDGDFIGILFIKFSSNPSYLIQYCMDGYADFSVKLPSDDKKVWRITRSRDGNTIKIQIHCNEVEVLNFVFSGDTCGSDWSSYWNREVARVSFSGEDTASESYRGGSGSWTAVSPFVDLETVPLEIKTSSKTGSGDQVSAEFYTLDGDFVGSLFIIFYPTPYYLIETCMKGGADFLVSLPSDDKKVWRITRSRDKDTKIQIHCNDVEVVNFVFSDDKCKSGSDWSSNWNREVARVSFSGKDTASESYRGGSACSAGNYMTGSGCQQCGENTYSGARAFSCTNCPSDEVSAAGSTSESDCASESEEHYQYSAGSSAWCSYIIGIVLAALFSIHIV